MLAAEHENKYIASANAGSSCTRSKAIDAILDFYRFLTDIPYIPPEKLMIPSGTGWDGVNAEELQRRGKTDEVIDLLRHLPYLDQELYSHHWTLSYNTLHINYANGELYDDFLEKDQAVLPLPGHIIWLSKGFERAGYYLLLNTQTWDIIEYTLLGESIEVDYKTYEALPVEIKWTAYSRMPADEYFYLWKWRHMTMSFVIVGDGKSYVGTAETFFKDPRHLFEDSLLPSDSEDEEDYLPDSISSDEDDDDEMDDSGEETGEETCEEIESIRAEIEELSLAEPDPSHEVNEDNNNNNNNNNDDDRPSKRNRSMLFLLTRIAKADEKHYFTEFSIARRKDMRELISIYVSHGWPMPAFEWKVSGREERIPPDVKDRLDLSGFDRAGCRERLDEWIRLWRERELAKLNELTKSMRS
ncbi:uncharacterized protein TRUGW13939_05747 [Talaromyces rugulosus]|uniref:Death domain-containing protein n=1 Tax=Talaromyces rugulosus TaxID=121627 RepID=A0A7H8QWY3_TALRU|nr:uncharacterized protein TRUGW13939_05747 [Talaromyces rugulosus]QKX58622.1 hypothetical protein TRUGW13939_05747 [Talaromyces rugulosus]